jgi:uncharacterized protein (DUF305 family)
MSMRRLSALLLLATAAVGLIACGGDGDTRDAQAQEATPAEMAFLTGMAHHHDTAIQMAEIARDRGQSSFVKNLAVNIVDTQRQEIDQMRQIHQRAFDRPLEPDPKAHDGLGLSAEEAGMTHTPAMNDELRRARPFDRAFVDMMVPHHLGAIRMAEAVLRDSRNPAVRELAETIIRDQKREVDEMNAFRERTYGAPVPKSAAGGGSEEEVPPGGAGGHQGH